jgi:hypothetical protein
MSASLCNNDSPIVIKIYIRRIWRDDYPMKLKLFAWLLIENKLLMWEKLQARGWEGPNRCILCKFASESTLHVFLHCSFIQVIWSNLASALKINSPWSGSNIQECFCIWLRITTYINCFPSTSAGMFGGLGTKQFFKIGLHPFLE